MKILSIRAQILTLITRMIFVLGASALFIPDTLFSQVSGSTLLLINYSETDIRKFFLNRGRGRGRERRDEEDEEGMIKVPINGNINIYAGNSQHCDLIYCLMANLSMFTAFANVAYKNLQTQSSLLMIICLLLWEMLY